MAKKWLEETNKSILYYEPYYEEIKLAEVFEEDSEWCFSSEILGVHEERLQSDNLEDVKNEVEDLIIQYLEDEIDYNKYLLESFNE